MRCVSQVHVARCYFSRRILSLGQRDYVAARTADSSIMSVPSGPDGTSIYNRTAIQVWVYRFSLALFDVDPGPLDLSST